jgi:PAN domain
MRMAVFAASLSLGLTVGFGQSSIEDNVDRPGLDYRNFDLRTPEPQLCQHACVGDNMCVAWTFVREGVQGPAARCWLKSQVPNPQSSPCCVSGVIQ